MSYKSEPYLVDADMKVFCGDALSVMRGLPDESVQMCCTSPPYWGLRNYDNDEQLGLEETPDQYVAKLVEIFRGVRRVLRDDGVLWLNIGDSYVSTAGSLRTLSNGGKSYQEMNKDGGDGRLLNSDRQRFGKDLRGDLKAKDLVGIPWMLAFALRADGWYLRADCIWDKPNAMPESVTDRPTKAHEYLFLLSKSRHYYYDNEAIKEPAVVGEDMGILRSQKAANGQGPTTRESIDKRLEVTPKRKGNPSQMRNVRSVWHIPTATYADAHYAVFPREIPLRCIRAGTSEKGCCPECGTPWVRDVQRIGGPQGDHTKAGLTDSGADAAVRETGHGHRASGTVLSERYREHGYPEMRTVGWLPGCDHKTTPEPCTVLDPFAGSGTVGLVARDLGRRSILIELNPEYVEQIAKRTQQFSLLAE